MFDHLPDLTAEEKAVNEKLSSKNCAFSKEEREILRRLDYKQKAFEKMNPARRIKKLLEDMAAHPKHGGFYKYILEETLPLIEKMEAIYKSDYVYRDDDLEYCLFELKIQTRYGEQLYPKEYLKHYLGKYHPIGHFLRKRRFKKRYGVEI